MLDPIASCMNEFERDIVTFLIDRVRRADRDGYFPPELKQWMQMLHRLRRHFTAVYNVQHTLPTTGQVLTPEQAANALRELAAEPPATPLT